MKCCLCVNNCFLVSFHNFVFQISSPCWWINSLFIIIFLFSLFILVQFIWFSSNNKFVCTADDQQKKYAQAVWLLKTMCSRWIGRMQNMSPISGVRTHHNHTDPPHSCVSCSKCFRIKIIIIILMHFVNCEYAWTRRYDIN